MLLNEKSCCPVVCGCSRYRSAGTVVVGGAAVGVGAATALLRGC
jgi:hypothetical protein